MKNGILSWALKNSVNYYRSANLHSNKMVGTLSPQKSWKQKMEIGGLKLLLSSKSILKL